MYPKNYFFALTKDGIDGRTSLLLDGGHRRRSSTATNSASKSSQRRQSLRQVDAPNSQTDEVKESSPANAPKLPEKSLSAETPDVEMDYLTGAMSSLQFVPTSVKFGRGRGKAGFAKK
ncbi:hypothetical protein RRF57_005281 [Xylaria bambusicola]|uniref:Uncharacterized protein n=1 Tax=Xylaria bambusicola TaxID=326684 RepID=A0AAN7UN95_9PEZI